MATELATRMAAIRRTGARAFVPFLTAGFPDVATFAALLRRTATADFLEIGLPFSDPVADGPSIQHASEVALAHGMHPDLLFETLAAAGSLPPVVIMTYTNPVLAYGAERFFERAHSAGARGVILTDLPPEEGASLHAAAAGAGIATVQLVAPTTPPDRVRQIAATTTGFLYCVAVTGTTGARAAVGSAARDTVARVREATALAVVVGFGISNPEQVREVCAFADGAVVGSALVDLVRRHDAASLPSHFERALVEYAAAAHAP